MKIPIRNSKSTQEENLISSFLGDESPKELTVKVVHEKSVEEIDDTLKRVAESFNKLSQPVKDEDTNNIDIIREHPTLENKKKVETVKTSFQRATFPSQSERMKEEEHRKLIEKRKQEQEQTAKENRRFIIFIIIAILGAIMLFNAKCNKSKSSHHYDHFDPSMEYRHS